MTCFPRLARPTQTGGTEEPRVPPLLNGNPGPQLQQPGRWTGACSLVRRVLGELFASHRPVHLDLGLFGLLGGLDQRRQQLSQLQ